MKKTLALILAAMMVAGTASVAFADASASVVFEDDTDTKVFVADEDADNEDDAALVSMVGKDIEWGDSLYLELEVAPETIELRKRKLPVTEQKLTGLLALTWLPAWTSSTKK